MRRWAVTWGAREAPEIGRPGVPTTVKKKPKPPPVQVGQAAEVAPGVLEHLTKCVEPCGYFKPLICTHLLDLTLGEDSTTKAHDCTKLQAKHSKKR